MIPDSTKPALWSRASTVALVAALVALLFALYTQHTWEDFYITFRTSKNFALGNGLVFTPGEYVHTFTSPLGVLLPAFASIAAGAASDDAALWIFRLVCIAAYGGAAALLFSALLRLGSRPMAAWAAVAFVFIESKSVDFSINGMETGFLLLFLAYTFWSMVTPSRRQWLHLGGAWAGLMWTRPDGFIYIGLLGSGFLVFDAIAGGRAKRGEVFLLLARAAVVCTVLYAPWFIWAWSYYGSPVPHTVIAKGSVEGPKTLQGFVSAFVTLPVKLWSGKTTIEGALLPTYYQGIQWSKPVWYTARLMGAIAAFAWLWPRLRPEVRAASFAFHGAHAYLTYFPYFPFPWYFPATTILGAMVWGGVLSHLFSTRKQVTDSPRSRAWRVVAAAAVVWVLAVEVYHSADAGVRFRTKQRLVDTGNLRRIGEWLRSHAEPTDYVFMEPLGYIGFYSQLRAYDYPGLSSPEMVATRKKVGNHWADILPALLPEWLVLRPIEADRLMQRKPELLTSIYKPVQVFDVSKIAPAYLSFDAIFTVYRRQPAYLHEHDIISLYDKFGNVAPVQWLGTTPVRMLHAPGTMSIRVPATAKHLEITYGFMPDAYAGDLKTDGVQFELVWEDGIERRVLLSRRLDPTNEPGDRGFQTFSDALPQARSDHARLLLHTSAGATETKDWSCWGGPVFRN